MPHRITTHHPSVSVTLALSPAETGFDLLIDLTLRHRIDEQTRPPMRIGAVIDRSGSMSDHGRLELAKEVVLTLSGAMEPADQLAVVAYDDKVRVLCGPVRPAEVPRRAIGELQPGGSTALFDGWTVAADVLGEHGTLIVLSDGHANIGPRDPATLSATAQAFHQQRRLRTTTIGIGDGYDEALLAGMAEAGRGRHYFARTVEDLRRAFDEESFAIARTAATDVTLTVDGHTLVIGSLEVDETVRRAIHLAQLPVSAQLTARLIGVDDPLSLDLSLPDEAASDDEVSLVALTETISRFFADAGASRLNRTEAAKLAERGAALSARLDAHPLGANDPVAVVLSKRLTEAVARLRRLALGDDPQMAGLFSKQAAVNQRPAASIGRMMLSESERDMLYAMPAAYSRPSPAGQAPAAIQLDLEVLALLPTERWRELRLLPLLRDAGGTVRLLTDQPRTYSAFKHVLMETGSRLPAGVHLDGLTPLSTAALDALLAQL